MRKLATLLLLGLCGLAVFWFISRPQPVDEARYRALQADAENGALVFHASGCASCHTASDTSFSEQPILAGGRAFSTDFGVFFAPNISPDATHGIGGWTVMEFANALQAGLSPEGTHYYPAFPYTAYARMTAQDVVDLKAFMDQLPPDQTINRPHVVGFPFDMRRPLGAWKVLFARKEWVLEEADSDEIARGRYLVEALAHCGECHTPRLAFGALDYENWLRGATLPGEGFVPGITPLQLDWLPEDIAFYLETGFTPDFDSAGGSMAHVVDNMSMLSANDRAAIAAYLAAMP